MHPGEGAPIPPARRPAASSAAWTRPSRSLPSRADGVSDRQTPAPAPPAAFRAVRQLPPQPQRWARPAPAAPPRARPSDPRAPRPGERPGQERAPSAAVTARPALAQGSTRRSSSERPHPSGPEGLRSPSNRRGGDAPEVTAQLLFSGRNPAAVPRFAVTGEPQEAGGGGGGGAQQCGETRPARSPAYQRRRRAVPAPAGLAFPIAARTNLENKITEQPPMAAAKATLRPPRLSTAAPLASRRRRGEQRPPSPDMSLTLPAPQAGPPAAAAAANQHAPAGAGRDIQINPTEKLLLERHQEAGKGAGQPGPTANGRREAGRGRPLGTLPPYQPSGGRGEPLYANDGRP